MRDPAVTGAGGGGGGVAALGAAALGASLAAGGASAAAEEEEEEESSAALGASAFFSALSTKKERDDGTRTREQRHSRQHWRGAWRTGACRGVALLQLEKHSTDWDCVTVLNQQLLYIASLWCPNVEANLLQ